MEPDVPPRVKYNEYCALMYTLKDTDPVYKEVFDVMCNPTYCEVTELDSCPDMNKLNDPTSYSRISCDGGKCKCIRCKRPF